MRASGPVNTRWLATGCWHQPLTDPNYREFVLQLIRQHRPRVFINTGDWHEAEAVNRFDKDFGFSLKEEMRAVAKDMQEIRLVATDYGCEEFIWMEGNHDANIRDWKRTNRGIRDLVDYREHFDLSRGYGIATELEHWKWYPYIYSQQYVHRVGQVTFSHGFKTGATADEAHALTLGLPYGLYVGTHTHRVMPVTQAHKNASTPLPYWYANPGTGRDLDKVPYMEKNNRDMWGQAVVIGDAAEWRYDRTMMPQVKQWDAETVVYQMFNERRAA